MYKRQGFTFTNYNAHDMLHVVQLALKTYTDDKKVWNTLVKRAMKGSYGWDHSAMDYIKLYKLLSEGDGTEEPGKAVQEEAAVPPKSPRARKTAPKAVAPVAKSDEKDDDPGMAEE